VLWSVRYLLTLFGRIHWLVLITVKEMLEFEEILISYIRNEIILLTKKFFQGQLLSNNSSIQIKRNQF